MKKKTPFFWHVRAEELEKQMRVFNLKPYENIENVTLEHVSDEFDKYVLDYQNEISASFQLLDIK